MAADTLCHSVINLLLKNWNRIELVCNTQQDLLQVN